jgi:hypothetical protein
MKHVAAAIRQGAMAFIRREYSTVFIFAVIIVIIIALAIGPSTAIANQCGPGLSSPDVYATSSWRFCRSASRFVSLQLRGDDMTREETSVPGSDPTRSTDRTSGKKAGVESTGHGLPANEQGQGAIGLNLFLEPGNKSREELIAGVKKGLLVTRFHYINGFIDTPKAILTGMTRDGVYLIEEGQLKHGVKNLRFTDSMLRAFSHVKGISKERQLIPSWWDSVGCIAAPTYHLGSFKFTGTTDF